MILNCWVKSKRWCADGANKSRDSKARGGWIWSVAHTSVQQIEWWVDLVWKWLRQRGWKSWWCTTTQSRSQSALTESPSAPLPLRCEAKMHLEKLKIPTSCHNKCRLRLLWVKVCIRAKEVKEGMVDHHLVVSCLLRYLHIWSPFSVLTLSFPLVQAVLIMDKLEYMDNSVLFVSN